MPTYTALFDIGAISANDLITYKSDHQTMIDQHGAETFIYTSLDAHNAIRDEMDIAIQRQEFINEISEFINKRNKEENITVFGKKYLTIFGPVFGFDKETKINAATKLMNLLEGKEITSFTKNERKALQDSRLGKLVAEFEDLVPEEVWEEADSDESFTID